MLISLDWIRDFVNISDQKTPSDLGVRLTMATAEVEEVQEVGAYWQKVKVVEVIEKEPHPEADKLNLVTFKISDDQTFRVVCGAGNVSVGMKAAFAPNGTTLPNGLTLEPRKIRGILSEGMLCSEEELGLAETSEGIIELDDSLPLGTSMGEVYKQSSDILFDIDNKSLTHRPDLWGHYGIAREFAAIYREELKNPFNEDWQNKILSQVTKDESPIKIKVDRDSSCLGYFGVSMDQVTIGESPNWLKTRLINVGLRPINNIVDVSNYVMLELGVPLHIFDRSKIKGGQVNIKRMGSDGVFKTLDEVDRQLTSSDTVICDANEPLVLAGIMGGLNSGVDDQTQNIFIEVANWVAPEVRKTSTRLGLRTDSSQRYEKSLDSALLKRTLCRTIELIQSLCPGAKIIGGVDYDGPEIKIKRSSMELNHKRIESVLGQKIASELVLSILSSLDFEVEKKGENYHILVPTYRSTKDINCTADIIEELGRMIGYDNITPEAPKLAISVSKLSSAQRLTRKMVDFLSLHGQSFEMQTSPMVGEKLLKKAEWPDFNEELRLVNAISNDQDRMRPSMLPSLMSVLANNTKNFEQCRFFEIGRSYLKDQKNFSKENHQLAVVFYDKNESVFMDLANTMEGLMRFTNLPGDLIGKHPKFKNELVLEDWQGIHPIEFYNIRVMGKMHGVIFGLHPLYLRKWKIKGHAAIALLNLNPFMEKPIKQKFKYKSIPKFQGSTFDYTVQVKNQTSVGEILATLKKVKMKEVQGHKVVDIFHDDDALKSVTIRTSFLDPEKTLSGEFLKGAEKSIIENLSNAGFPLKQG